MRKISNSQRSKIAKLVITNTVIAAAQANLKRASEQGSRRNPHRNKNFQLRHDASGILNHTATDFSPNDNSLHTHCVYIPKSAGDFGYMKFVKVWLKSSI